MKMIRAALLAFLWISGLLSTVCAHAQEKPPPPPPPPFGEDPGSGRPPRQGQDAERREKIDRLEAEIRELEGALKRDDVPAERRDEVKKRLSEKYAQLKELRGGDDGWWKEPKHEVGEKMRRLEMRIHELETALRTKDLGPEDRKEMTAQLHHAQAQMHELRAQAARQDPIKKHDPHGPPGLPMDPESHKLHMAAQELEHHTHQISAKLRKTPAEETKAREELKGLLVENVTKLFDLREKLRAREIDLIRKRLEELTQMLEKRKVNRQAIIEKRVKQLTGESDDLDW